MTAQVDVLAVLDEAQDWLYRSSEGRGDDDRAEAVKQSRNAVAELIAADREYNVALAEAKDLNRKVAERGWFEIEFDSLRKSGERVVAAQIRRDRALSCFSGAA